MKRSIIQGLAMATMVLLLANCSEKAAFYTNSLRTDVFTQKYNNQKYDFLWVFDSSDSMKPRRDVIVNDMQNFMNILNKRKALDFQMAITTMNMFTTTSGPTHPGVQGNLVENPSGLTVVKSETSTDPVADFASIMNNFSAEATTKATSFWEQGLETSYQAIHNHGSEFMRPGVPLILIYISDEDDYSCSGNCWGSEPEHNDNWIPFTMDRYLQYFTTVKKPENSSVEVFAITATDYTTCPVPTVGSRYMELSASLEGLGVAGSICDNFLQNSYENIARVIADRGVKFPLQQKSNGKGINVYVDNQLVPYSPDNYIYDEASNSIIFTGAIPPNGSQIVVVYEQLTN